VAFVSGREGERDIYLARVADRKSERLTTGAHVTNDVAKWSPDGSRLAVQVAHDRNYDIEVVSGNGKRVRIAASPEYDGQYSWSPDGTRIAYISERADAPGVYVVDVRNGRTRRIVAGAPLNPAWAN
jgi:TolB protein